MGRGLIWLTFPNHLEVPLFTEPDHDLIRDKYLPSDIVASVAATVGTLGRLAIRLSDRAGMEAMRRRRTTDDRRAITPLLTIFGSLLLSSFIFSLLLLSCGVGSAALAKILVLKTRLGVEAMRRKLDFDGFFLKAAVVFGDVATCATLPSCGAAAVAGVAAALLAILISFGLRGCCCGSHPGKDVMRRSLDETMVEAPL